VSRSWTGSRTLLATSAWFAARPSGTEDLYKIYGESFKGAEHLEQVFEQAREVVSTALEA
jgi:phosphoglucomutase